MRKWRSRKRGTKKRGKEGNQQDKWRERDEEEIEKGMGKWRRERGGRSGKRTETEGQ